ncbi:ABC transporter substrate-binding protein [Pseudoduganella namucuonensis]|uniref:Amino acid/amide ABC transporter substrate-binding protein, HAAT family n=1 Tax=Pseudoduganella namucuonensis TaxID=1035707 RepID=A0A1I7LNZ0_9BURK|nr:ABC transporter substrate-binding protein [Pseudoduganella namucuonensis]SFV11427.1 amino acid/amide ABC transporter substrate-binding protein, HAAT family [Pseudoduganella namucuonensis]
MKRLTPIRSAALAAAMSLPLLAHAADLKLGFITSLSGSASSLGIPYAKGLQAGMAFRPNVDGKKVTVVQLDDASDPTTAARNARKLIVEDNVDALIGTAGTPSGLAINGVALEYKVPFISISQSKVDGPDGAWMVTVPQSAPLMIDTVAAHMKQNGVKTVAYIGFSDAWGDLVYDALQAAAKKHGLTVLTNERYARTDSSVTGQVLKIVAAKPDAVLAGNSGTPGALPYLGLSARGYRGKIYGTHGIINPDFIRVGGASLENLLAPTGPVVVADQLPASHPSRKVALDFRAVYQKTFQAVPTDAFAPYAFDAWLIFTDAAQRALAKKQPGTAEFRVALHDAVTSTKELVGTQGVYNFRRDSRFGSDERAVVMVKLEKGQWKYLP